MFNKLVPLIGIVFFTITSNVKAETFKLLSTNYNDGYTITNYTSTAPVTVNFSYGYHEHTDSPMLFDIKSFTKTKLSRAQIEYSDYRKIQGFFNIPLKPTPPNCFYEGRAVLDFGLITLWYPDVGSIDAIASDITKVYSASKPQLNCR